jgi:hypothetical protein
MAFFLHLDYLPLRMGVTFLCSGCVGKISECLKISDCLHVDYSPQCQLRGTVINWIKWLNIKW